MGNLWIAKFPSKHDTYDSGKWEMVAHDLADFLKSNGAAPREDLRELWKRMVFNMAVSNTDDHLRNHGFLLDKNGWRLSPVYDDINYNFALDGSDMACYQI